MAELPPALAAALRGDRPLLFGSVEIALPGYDLLLLDGAAELMIDGRKFVGRDPIYGVLDTVKGLADSLGDKAPAVTLGLKVQGDTALATLLDPAVQGSAVTIAVGAVDPWTGLPVTRPDTLWNSLKMMLQAGGAQPALVGGVITSINRAPRVSLATITRSDIVGKCTFAGTQPRRSRINSVIPQYRSEAHDWEMVSASAVSIADYVALDGDERTQEIAYQLVQDVNQAAQLATYDICDAREAGPGSIPLGPWWLNYKPGDCVTFEPEDGFSIKVMLTGRTLEAQSGVVTYTVRGETDGKHALALGQTGQAPPIVSLVYDTTVAAPAAGQWALSGATLSASGGAIPALHITGSAENASAQEVIFEYRLDGTAGWTAAGSEAPGTADKVISSVAPGAAYDVAVSYRVRGVLGERLVLGPVTAGDLSTARAAYQIVRQTVDYPVSDTSTAIAMAAFDAVLDDGRSISFPAASIPTAAATSYVVLWDLQTSTYIASVAPALDQVSSSRYVIIRNYTTGNADGTYPEQPTAPGGDGGGGYGGSTGCPVPEAMVLLANASRENPGDLVMAGTLTRVWTGCGLRMSGPAHGARGPSPRRGGSRAKSGRRTAGPTRRPRTCGGSTAIGSEWTRSACRLVGPAPSWRSRLATLTPTC